jgi:hypothetical protein
VESHGDKARITKRIGCGAAAVASAKVTGHALVAEDEDGVAIAAKPVAIPIAVPIAVSVPVAPAIMIAVPILRSILLRGSQCPQSDCEQDREYRYDPCRATLPRSL